MAKHAKPTRGMTFATNGARGTAVLALGAAGLITAGSPALADAPPPSERVNGDHEPKQEHKQHPQKKVVKKKVVNKKVVNKKVIVQQEDDSDKIDNSSGLVNVADNNVQVPVQVCNNNVPVNVAGVQVAAENIAGALGLLSEEGSDVESSNDKNCEQGSGQQEGDNTLGDGSGGGGDEINNSNGVVNIADNQVQIPLQICNNNVPVNALLGVQVVGENVAGGLGLIPRDDENGSMIEASNDKNCEQGQAQQDGNNTATGGEDVPFQASALGEDDGDGHSETSQVSGGAGGGDTIDNSNGVVNIADNNVQIPVQACNNNVPVNVLGVQVGAEAVAGVLDLLADEGTDAEASNDKNCEQGSAQQEGDNTAAVGGDVPGRD